MDDGACSVGCQCKLQWMDTKFRVCLGKSYQLVYFIFSYQCYHLWKKIFLSLLNSLRISLLTHFQHQRFFSLVNVSRNWALLIPLLSYNSPNSLIFINFFFFCLQNVCPETQSSFLSKLLFSWFDSLAAKGYRKPLENEDLWELDYSNTCASIVPDFEKNWLITLEKTKR